MPIRRFIVAAQECTDCARMRTAACAPYHAEDVYCARHVPVLSDRERSILDAFIDGLLARRGSHHGGESLTNSIHMVKRRLLSDMRSMKVV